MNPELIHNLSDDEFLRMIERDDPIISDALDRIERLVSAESGRISYLEHELEAAKDIAGQLYRSLESVDSE